MRNLLVSILFLPLTHCSHPTSEKAPHKDYFDLTAYFDHQIDLLDSLNPVTEKTIVKDGKSETQVLKNIFWKKELGVFSSCDINRPAWRGLYRCDTLRNSGKLTLRYLTGDPKLPVKRLEITMETGPEYSGEDPMHCPRLHIIRFNKNFLYSHRQEIIFLPDSGYRLKGEMGILFFHPSIYEVALGWEKKDVGME